MVSSKLSILVVDDNEEFSQNVADILDLHGYAAVTASDGFKALEVLEQSRFDLVLMDVKMPVMDGVETFKKIKEQAPGTPVVMMTAFAVEDLIREALRGGAYGFLDKPLDFDQLLLLITQATGEGALILVTDDDEELCANIQEILSDRGYRVRVAYDGGTAVTEAQQNAFDIMLMDLKLPVLNGLETYLAIRDFRPDVVAVMITGYRREMNNLLQEALQKGVYTCIEKPIDMDELITLLQQIEEQHAGDTLNKPR